VGGGRGAAGGTGPDLRLGIGRATENQVSQCFVRVPKSPCRE
jgi:hypothetical protein